MPNTNQNLNSLDTFLGRPQNTKFHQNEFNSFRNETETPTDMTSSLRTDFMHFVNRMHNPKYLQRAEK